MGEGRRGGLNAEGAPTESGQAPSAEKKRRDSLLCRAPVGPEPGLRDAREETADPSLPFAPQTRPERKQRGSSTQRHRGRGGEPRMPEGFLPTGSELADTARRLSSG